MYTQKFVNLVMGDRSIYPIPFDKKEQQQIDFDSPKTKQLLCEGYTISNLSDFYTLDLKQLEEFAQSFKPDTKSGYILRKSFADSKKFKNYSEEEWRVIFAQYSLTYGWANQYQDFFGSPAATVLNDYNNEDVSTVEQIMNDSKVIKIGFRKDTVALIREILESKVILRAHQKKTLEACPTDVLLDAYRKANITIRETLIKVIKLLSTTGTKGLFKTPTDVLRYILAVYAHQPFEGQITKPDLTDRKVKIPTSARKWLISELNTMRNAHVICEDIFKYESYWKLMHRYLRYGKAKTARERFPVYHEAIDLLYNGDRSWTFNGRYSSAIEDGDYDAALNVARERPGFLLRNMLNFLRYPEGTKIAQVAPITSRKVSLDPTVKPTVKKVIHSNTDWFYSNEFVELIKRSNTKLAFQLLEQLQNPAIYADQTTRTVQGVTKSYSVPIPGIKKKIAKNVRKAIRQGIALQLQERNVNVGKVYIDKTLKNNVLQYSGRNSTELNYSGKFLTPGSTIDIPDERILRLGVLWRGRSTDIDHNVSIFNGFKKVKDVYFVNPVYKNIVNSSGDITYCDKEHFSAEFIDIDLKEVRKENITSLITSLISFSGNPISDTECYLFIKVMKRKERIVSDRSFTIDLMDTDYAIRLDPDAVERSTSYIGFNVTLDDNKIQVCAYTPKDSGLYSTIRSKKFTPAFLDGIFSNQTSLYKTLKMAFTKEQIVKKAEDADVIFGEGGFDPNTQFEEINKFIL